MAHAQDDSNVAQPEILTLHWEGPEAAEAPPEHRFPDSRVEEEARREAERERELAETLRTKQGAEIWERIRCEAGARGDEKHWRRKLHAYWWVKMRSEGNAAAYARREGLNHATVRTWIADVAKLAYEVGYRLHEDRLVLVGEAPPELDRLRALVNEDAGSPEACAELRRVAPRFRGEDPYFHLNDGHVQRALGRLRASDETLREGLAIAEAPRVRSLLWNARGQTYWDCTATSSYPLRDHLVRAEKAFRRAAVLDRTTFFPFVNLAQMALDGGDDRRCEYWMGELAEARRSMTDTMKDSLARYLVEAEWTRPVEQRRSWRTGPARWISEAARRGALVLVLAASLLFAGTDVLANDGRRGSSNSGAGGNLSTNGDIVE